MIILLSPLIKNKILRCIYLTLITTLALVSLGGIVCHPYSVDENDEGGVCKVVNRVIGLVTPSGLYYRSR